MSYEVECARCGNRHSMRSSHVCMADVLEELRQLNKCLREFLSQQTTAAKKTPLGQREIASR